MKQRVILLLLALIGWGLAGYLITRPAPKPIVQEVYKETTRDQVVVKTYQETVTAPDGTVTKRDVQETQKTAQTSISARRETPSPLKLPRYSLGISALLDPARPLKPHVYEIEVSRRLWETPAWATIAVNTKKEITLGIRIEF